MNLSMTRFFSRLACSLILVAGSSNLFADPSKLMVATGQTLSKVRVEVLSVDESDGTAEVRFSGRDCRYCDEVYLVDQTTELITLDYRGPMNLDLLKEKAFVTGSARVVIADKWVQEVRYVTHAE